MGMQRFPYQKNYDIFVDINLSFDKFSSNTCFFLTLYVKKKREIKHSVVGSISELLMNKDILFDANSNLILFH